MASDMDSPPDEKDQQQDMPDTPDTPTQPHSPRTGIGSPTEADVSIRCCSMGGRDIHQLSRARYRETILPADHCTMSLSRPSMLCTPAVLFVIAT